MNNDPKDLQKQKDQQSKNNQFGTKLDPDAQHDNKRSSTGGTGGDLGKNAGNQDNPNQGQQRK